MTPRAGARPERGTRPAAESDGALRGTGVEGSPTTRGDVSNFTMTRRARGQMVQEAGA